MWQEGPIVDARLGTLGSLSGSRGSALSRSCALRFSKDGPPCLRLVILIYQRPAAPTLRISREDGTTRRSELGTGTHH